MTNNLSSSIKTKELNTLKYSQKHDIIKVRKGCVDMWNAFMVRGAAFTNNDIPYSPTTAFTVPVSLVSYEEAKTIHKNAMHNGHTDYIVKAFVHFFLDDQKFDGKERASGGIPKRHWKFSVISQVSSPRISPRTQISLSQLSVTISTECVHSDIGFPLRGSLLSTTSAGERRKHGTIVGTEFRITALLQSAP